MIEFVVDILLLLLFFFIFFKFINFGIDSLINKWYPSKEDNSTNPVETKQFSKKILKEKKVIKTSESRVENSSLYHVYTASLTDTIEYQNQEWQIVFMIKTNWLNGASAVQFQVTNATNDMRLLYLEQEKAIINDFEEEKIKLHKIDKHQISEAQCPEQLQFEGQIYLLDNQKIGECRINTEKSTYKTHLWIYQTEDGQSQIRVVNVQGVYSYYHGKPLEVTDFVDDTLDLNEKPVDRVVLKAKNRDNKNNL